MGWAAPDWKREIQPFFENYCFDCHADGVEKGDLSLDAYTSEAAILKDIKVWGTVLEGRVQPVGATVQEDAGLNRPEIPNSREFAYRAMHHALKAVHSHV